MRHQEELNTVLTISVYDVDRNEKARLHKQEQVNNVCVQQCADSV